MSDTILVNTQNAIPEAADLGQQVVHDSAAILSYVIGRGVNETISDYYGDPNLDFKSN